MSSGRPARWRVAHAKSARLLAHVVSVMAGTTGRTAPDG